MTPTVFLGHPPVGVGGAGDLSGVVVRLVMPVQAQLSQEAAAPRAQRGEQHRLRDTTAVCLT